MVGRLIFRRCVAGVLLLGLLAACGGGGKKAASASGGSSTGPAVSTPAAPLGKLTVQPVADFADRVLTNAFGDGTAIIALSESQDADRRPSRSLMRLDTNGAITQEVPLGTSDSIYGFVKTSAGRFAMGTFFDENASNRYMCGYRALDPVALTLGPTIQINDSGRCGGGGDMNSGVDGAVVWTSDSQANTLVRVDTAAGTVTSVPLTDALPAGYDIGGYPATVIDHNVFLTLTARFDQATGSQVTDANGNPLPAQLVKVDGTSSQVTVKQVPGQLTINDQRLIVYVTAAGGNAPTTFSEVDPKTLELRDLKQQDVPGQTGSVLAEGNGVSWSVDSTGEKIVRITQRDPSKGNRAVAEGQVDTGVTNFRGLTPIAIGADVFILVASSNYDQATQTSTNDSKLFKASKV
jgi:hypothetical protein